MVESPQRIWIEANDECPYFYEAHELHDVEQDVIEYVRADLYAALEAKLAEAEEYLRNLLVGFVQEHFPDNTEWKPIKGDLMGLLTQMDNASTIAREYKAQLAALSPAPEAQQEPVAWRWKPKDSAAWIYDPKPEWLEAQSRDEIDAEPLFTRPAEQAVTKAMGATLKAAMEARE